MAATETRITDLPAASVVTAAHSVIVETEFGTQLATVEQLNSAANGTMVAALEAALAAFSATVS